VFPGKGDVDGVRAVLHALTGMRVSKLSDQGSAPELLRD
jgi:hypothetical protein